MSVLSKLKEAVRGSGLYAVYRKNRPALLNALHIELVFPIQVETPVALLGSENWGYRVTEDLLHSGDDRPPVAYAFGLGDDISFEKDVICRLNTTLYAFDAMPAVIQKYRDRVAGMRMLEYALSDHDGKAMFYFPVNPAHISGALDTEYNWHELSKTGVEVEVRRLSSIMAELGHDHIDLLKMNVEGAEYYVVPDILKSGLSISEIALAVHGRFMKHGYRRDKRLLKQMNRAGYSVAYYDYSNARVLFVRTPSGE